MKRFQVRVTPDVTGYGLYDTAKGAYVVRRGRILSLDEVGAVKAARLANANAAGTQVRAQRVSAARAKQIIEQARAATTVGPWVDQLDKVMAPGERAFVKKAWERLPGSYSFVGTLERIAKGGSPLRRHRNPRASGPYSVQVLHATGGYTNKFFGVKLPEARKAFRAACDAYSSDPTKEVLLTGYNGAEKVTIEGCGRGWKKNPSTSPARSEFNAAFRAHRAWRERKIPISEYSAATFRKGIPAVYAEEAYRAGRKEWASDVPSRLTWKRDSHGRLDAYIGGGFYVTVAPNTRGHQGFVAAIDYLGIAGPEKYIDDKGRSDYGTVVGRNIVFPTEAAAKLAASRYLMSRRRPNKTAGAHLREIDSKRRNNPRDEYGQLIRTAAEREEAAREMAAFSAAQDRRKWKMAENARDADNERRGRKL